MNNAPVMVTVRRGRDVSRVDGTRVTFSPHQCFAFDDGQDDRRCIEALARHIVSMPAPALVGTKKFIEYILRLAPALSQYLVACIPYDTVDSSNPSAVSSPSIPLLPGEVQSVFLCETLAYPRAYLRRQLEGRFRVDDPTVLSEVATDIVPRRSWTPLQRNIYPIDLPEVKVADGLDFVIVDCPSRNLSLMPNGLAYVNNALKKTSVSFQIVDLDIIAYHRYHMHRLFDVGGEVVLPGGLVVPEDPWQAEHYDLWTTSGGGAAGPTGKNEVLEFFRPLLNELIDEVVRARPKVLGLSIQGCNEAAAKEVALGVKARHPDVVIVVGGFSCYNADVGRRAFPECDYMCVGESDLTVGPLIEALARGERPFNQPGILSRFDTPDYRYLPAPMIHNLDQIEFPKYEWCDLKVYRNFNDYQLTPIIASRGCRWSRCTFCAERFYWRIRTPENFVDELEWLVDQGCHLFMFNESDLNGMPERVMEICDEIIRRGLHRKVKLTGQLRIHKKSSRAFFEKLRAANFVALRFGVDAFSENTLRLQKKGYTVDMVSQNLKDCWEVGIFTEVNWVIGVPGETDLDVEEGIQLILKNRQYIGRLANINPLILVNGSVYWIDPDAHDIVFRQPKDDLYAQYPRALPADQWYSVNPYIDAQVRKERFERIVTALHDAGFNVGAWANRIIEDVKLSRDKARTGGSATGGDFGEFSTREAVDVAIEGDIAASEPIDADASASTQERVGGFRKVIPLELVADDESGVPRKPLAEPPMFRVAGEPPRLVCRTDTHEVLFYDGWYYGVPQALTGIDITSPDNANMSGILRHNTEADALAAIEEAARWANSRGQYDDQRRQRAGGSYMRADSVGELTTPAAVRESAHILRFGKQFISVEREVLGEAISGRKRGGGQAAEPNTAVAVPLQGGSILRRVASHLPSGTIRRIRQLIRQQHLSSSTEASPLITKSDGELARMLMRSMIQNYVVRPITNLVDAGGASAMGQSEVVSVDGESLSIVSVVSKDAQPELMWTIGNYNLVKFDGTFYGIPHGTSVDWEGGDLLALPGMISGADFGTVVSAIDARMPKKETGRTEGAAVAVREQIVPNVPTLLKTMADQSYNVVAYEGWVYGIPHSLGQLDLTETDVMEMSGVVRDVSQDVVENEILLRAQEKLQAA